MLSLSLSLSLSITVVRYISTYTKISMKVYARELPYLSQIGEPLWSSCLQLLENQLKNQHTTQMI